MGKQKEEAANIISVIDGFVPAEKGYKVVVASPVPTKKHWWSKKTNYALAHVIFWANLAFVGPEGRTSDQIVPIVRFKGQLVPGNHIPGYVGFIRKGEKENLYEPEANEVVANWKEQEATRQKAIRATLN